MKEIQHYDNITMTPVTPNLPRIEPIKLFRGSYSLNSLYTFNTEEASNIINSSDIIVTIEPHTRYSSQIAKLATNSNKRLIVLSENDPSLGIPKLPPYNIYSKFVIGRASAIGSATVLSDSYLTHLGVRHMDRVFVNAVNTDVYKPNDRDLLEHKILFVGHLELEKGFVTLIKALNKLAECHSFSVFIVGDGTLVNILRDAKFRYKHFKFLPYLELIRLYRECDILVTPSESVRKYGITVWTEVFGLSNLEAMSCGMATVTSDCGNLPYVIQDKECVFKQGNWSELSEKLSALFENPEKIKRNGYSNRKYLEEMFNKMIIKKAWMRLINASTE